MVRTSQAVPAESLKVLPPVATTQGTNTEVVDDLAEKNRLSSFGDRLFRHHDEPVCEGEEAGFEPFEEGFPEL